MTTKTEQHTPGPWHVSEGRESVCALAVDHEGPDSRQVAMVSDPNDPMHANPVAKANAKLIAAAPELLEALRDALPCLGVAINEGAFNHSAAPLAAARVLDQAEAAIFAAEGR